MVRHGIVHIRRDAAAMKPLPHDLTIVSQRHGYVSDVGRRVRRQNVHRRSVRRSDIATYDVSAAVVVLWQPRQPGPQDRSLQLVKAAVAASSLCDDVFVLPTVLPKTYESSREILMIRRDGTAVAKTTQILRWIEAEGRCVAKGAGSFTSSLGPHGLCTVFKQRYLMLTTDIGKLLYLGKTAIQVCDDNHCDVPVSEDIGNNIHIEVHRGWINVGVGWSQSRPPGGDASVTARIRRG